MKVWITKYALTKGILEEDAIDIGDGFVSVKRKWTTEYFRNSEWHDTREAAVERAEVMRQKKIKSLEKQIEKLKKLSW